MNITKTTKGPVELNVKRFYLPFMLEYDCSECGASVHRDFQDMYLSCPSTGQQTITACCGECEHEQDIEVVLDVTLRLADTAENLDGKYRLFEIDWTDVAPTIKVEGVRAYSPPAKNGQRVNDGKDFYFIFGFTDRAHWSFGKDYSLIASDETKNFKYAIGRRKE